MRKIAILTLATILIAVSVAAIPVVEVLDPNGGELIQKGTSYTIDWTIYDLTNPQTLTAQFWYSDTPLAYTNLINMTPIDLMGGGFCAPSYQQENIWGYYSKYSNSAIPDKTELHIIDWLDDSFDGKLMYFGYDNPPTGSPNSGYINTEDFTSPTRGEFTSTSDLNGNFIPPSYSSPWTEQSNAKVFYLTGENQPSILYTQYYYVTPFDHYVRQQIRQDWLYDDHFGTAINDVNIFKWFDHQVYTQSYGDCAMRTGNPSESVIFYEDVQIFQHEGYMWVLGNWRGGCGKRICGISTGCIGCLGAYKYLGNDVWQRDTKYISNVNDWNLTAGWLGNRDDCFQTNFNINFYVRGGLLYAVGTDEFGSPAAIRWSTGNQKWYDVPDFNNGITAPFWNLVGGGGYATFARAWEYNGYEYILQQSGNDYGLWTRRSFWTTEDTRTCSYAWDTTTASTGQWYLDIVVTGAESGSDSGDNYFTIQTEPVPPVANDAWEVTAISGASAVELSLTTNDVNITAQGTDIVLMVEHIRAEWDSLSIDTLYPNTDGRQYWIYKINCDITENCLAYQQGQWQFQSSLTYGTPTDGVADDAMMKIWNNDAEAYQYSFDHESIFTNGQITYFKLVYRYPIRIWDDLSDESEWLMASIPPTHEIKNGSYWDYWTVTGTSQINQQLIETIPSIDPDEAYYEFQFTAYGLGAETIYIGEEGNWREVNITTEPKRYSVQINDLNALWIRTTATTANIVYLANTVLLNRGYFKTGLELMKENYEPLNVWIDPEAGDNVIDVEIIDGVAEKRLYGSTPQGQTFRTSNSSAINQICVKGWRTKEDVSCGSGEYISEGGSVVLQLWDNPSKDNFKGQSTVSYSAFPEGCLGGDPVSPDADWVCWDMGDQAEAYTDYYFELITTDVNGYNIILKNPSYYEFGVFYLDGTSPQPDTDMEFKTYIDTIGISYKFINEGAGFRFNTLAYDREQKLTQFKVEVYAWTVDDLNKIQVYYKDLESPVQEYFFDLSDLVSPVYIVNEPSPVGSILQRRDPIKIVVSLCDDEQCYEQQSAWIMLHHYPFFSNDAMIQIQEETRQPNKAPKGDVILRGTEPDNFSAVRMYIYYGDWLCNPNYAISDPWTCNSQNTASDDALIYEHTFYKEIDFTCPSDSCDFEYDLENYWHYPNEGYYTTFAEVVFKTTDANSWIGRTIYPIGAQPLIMGLEFQGYDTENYVDEACIDNVAGVLVADIISAGEAGIVFLLLGEPILWVGWVLGTWTPTDAVSLYTAFASGEELTLGSPFGQYVGTTGCNATIPSETNVKLVAKVISAQWDDIHEYIVGSFEVRTLGGSTITPRFYPVEQFYQPETGQNVILFNTNIYDWNGNRLEDDDYNIVVFIEDQSYQNKDVEGSLGLTIDDSLVITQPQNVEIIPLNLWASDGELDTITFRQWVATRRKYIDKIEYELYTPYSSFDPNASDAENQIIRFDIDAEELLILEENPYNLDANMLFNRFKYENINSDVVGACISWSPWAAVGGAIVGAGLVLTGVGAPLGAFVLGGVIIGGGVGCLGGATTSWATGEMENMELDSEFVTLMNDTNYNRTREINIQFKNLHVNDYYDTLELYGLDEDEVGREVLINTLNEQGHTIPEGSVAIYVNGRKFESPNYLVADGTLFENLKQHRVKMRMKIYYDYFQRTTIGNYEFVTFDMPSAGLDDTFETTATDWQKAVIYTFNRFSPLLIAIALILVGLAFIVPMFRGRGKQQPIVIRK